MDFQVITQNHFEALCTLHAKGIGLEIPVKAQPSTVDFKICIPDHTYQTNVTVFNSDKIVRRVKWKVPSLLQNYLQIQPDHSFVQAQGQNDFLLRFTPRTELLKQGEQYRNQNMRFLDEKLHVLCTLLEQTVTLDVTILAVLTSTDLTFDPEEIDFGQCTTQYCLRKKLEVTNHSILEQSLEFIGVPKFADVQPGDGFMRLLPGETVELDVIFSPLKPGEYQWSLYSKTLSGRQFHLKCTGKGVQLPLVISSPVVHFPPTPMNHYSNVTLHLRQPSLSKKPANLTENPVSFEFVVSEDAPITISPLVGTVEEGKNFKIIVTFHPKLDETEVKLQAAKLETEKQKRKAKEDLQQKIHLQQQLLLKEKEMQQKLPKNKKLASITDQTEIEDFSQLHELKPVKPEEIEVGSSMYNLGLVSLLENVKPIVKKYTVPCFITHARLSLLKKPMYNVENTLYLELHCPVVQPPFVVKDGNKLHNYGKVPIGKRVIWAFQLINQSTESLKLHSTLLDDYGPFQLVNALRTIPPSYSHFLRIAFTPFSEQKYYDQIRVSVTTPVFTEIVLRLEGTGVEPQVQVCWNSDTILQFGWVMIEETVRQTVHIENKTCVPVEIKCEVNSGEKTLHCSYYPRELPFILYASSVSISAESKEQIFLTFNPNVAGCYRGQLEVTLFKKPLCTISLEGYCCENIVYLMGGLKQQLHDKTPPKPSSDIRERFCFNLASSNNSAITEFKIGCVKSEKIKIKKGVEFKFEELALATEAGYSIEPVKGIVPQGDEIAVSVKWSPVPSKISHSPKMMKAYKLPSSKPQPVIKSPRTSKYPKAANLPKSPQKIEFCSIKSETLKSPSAPHSTELMKASDIPVDENQVSVFSEVVVYLVVKADTIFKYEIFLTVDNILPMR
ncbi:cilia- and flagella-associated protein 74-like [Limulus polyphemus]|uniref:Cilia- and flagella-associated protein 74-like n=1 Tax=Limulus polyphemus TaxID=6850 RepID=A0ABM1T0Z2_LIMPO|nr:cilia- and flagella-associated protein 74-like [Limulus polyphemus]